MSIEDLRIEYHEKIFQYRKLMQFNSKESECRMNDSIDRLYELKKDLDRISSKLISANPTWTEIYSQHLSDSDLMKIFENCYRPDTVSVTFKINDTEIMQAFSIQAFSDLSSRMNINMIQKFTEIAYREFKQFAIKKYYEKSRNYKEQ